uniref:Uncharacterized protein n=1 Tax=Peronospora matthiolae TaxID=2874970 RepID=A0AAV1TWW3_9STRA
MTVDSFRDFASRTQISDVLKGASANPGKRDCHVKDVKVLVTMLSRSWMIEEESVQCTEQQQIQAAVSGTWTIKEVPTSETCGASKRTATTAP